MGIEAVVIHSGGMDSSLCLAWAIREYGAKAVRSLSFSYGQRHSVELDIAREISNRWGVLNTVVNINCLSDITTNALLDHDLKITQEKGEVPNTLVSGRNGLMMRLAGIQAETWGCSRIVTGIIEVEEANSGYRDCTRVYANLIQEALRIDFGNPSFEILTPVVFMTKKQTMDMGNELGVLRELLENTISCYEGISQMGCQKCPACDLRNEGIRAFLNENPEFKFSYKDDFAL